jgi:hypothetical protein
MHLTKTLRMFGIVAALTGCTAVQSFALLSNETGITSYSDETLTEEVGSKFHGCSGEHVLDGQRTAHGVATSSPGQRDELGEIDCSLNGHRTWCPEDICQSPLFEWYEEGSGR